MDKRNRLERAWDAGYREGFKKAAEVRFKDALANPDFKRWVIEIVTQKAIDEQVAERTAAEVKKKTDRNNAYRRKKYAEDPAYRQMMLDKQSAYYQKHKAELMERNKQYRKEHPEKQAEYKAKYYEKNKEKMKEWNARYYTAHREEILERKKNNAAKRNAEIGNSGAGTSEGPLPGSEVKERRTD